MENPTRPENANLKKKDMLSRENTAIGSPRTSANCKRQMSWDRIMKPSSRWTSGLKSKQESKPNSIGLWSGELWQRITGFRPVNYQRYVSSSVIIRAHQRTSWEYHAHTGYSTSRSGSLHTSRTNTSQIEIVYIWKVKKPVGQFQ